MTVTATAEQLLDSLLDSFCAECGEALPEPGLPCGSCGAVPPVTRQEAAARLEVPGAIVMLEAARLRGEARQAQDQVSALLAQADMIEHADRLAQARDQAADRIPPVRAEVARLGRELKKAQGREREAEQCTEDARGNFMAAAKAEEAARRCGADAAARTDALVKMNAAASVLQADQGALQGASAVRRQAEDALAAARTQLAGLEDGLEAAQRATDNPGLLLRSVLTLTMDLPRQVLAGDLTEAEQAIVRSLGEALAGYAGAAADIAARAVQLAEEERTGRFRRQPFYARPASGGNVEIIANPATGGRPLP